MEEKFEWIKELITSEEQLEENGLFYYDPNDPDRQLIGSTLSFLLKIRRQMQEAVLRFNEFKHENTSKIKIYGIAKTAADFMLFRNGIKLIFALKNPGVISIRFHFMNPALPTVATMNFLEANVSQPLSSSQFQGEETILEFQWGPFNEEIWLKKSQPIKLEYLVKYYMTRFVQDSTTPSI